MISCPLLLLQVFIKSELKVGVIFVKEEQYTEEQILDNNENSALFDEFLTLLGDRVRLRGFDKYKGGLDTVHDLTGLCLLRPSLSLTLSIDVFLYALRSILRLYELAQH